jgi:ferredoxin
MGFRIRVDRDSCQSSGRCVSAAPGVFAFDADRLAVAGPAASLTREAALAIARGCPALAIEVIGDDGKALEL